MKLSIWLRTRDQDTWIVTIEAVLIGFVLLVEPSPYARLLAVALLGHLAWVTTDLLRMTRNGRSRAGSRAVRANHELRTHVIHFLREIKRVEAFRRRAAASPLSSEQVNERIVAAQLQILTAASKAAKVVGRDTDVSSDLNGLRPPPDPWTVAGN